MSSKRRVQTGKVFVPVNFTSKLDDLLDEISESLRPEKLYKPIIATLKTDGRSKTKVDLNLCRPVSTSNPIRMISKETIQRTKELEDLVIIWLDPNMNETEEEFITRKGDLREIVDYITAFSDIDKCFNHIKTIKEEKIFLIVTGLLDTSYIDIIEESSQITLVYIYNQSKSRYRGWHKIPKKVVGTFKEEHELIARVKSNVTSFLKNTLSISIINSIENIEQPVRNLTKNQAQFIWPQVLVEALPNIPQTPKSKQELIEECRRRLKKNSTQKNKIIEFEKIYDSMNALSWYTYDNFLYGIVNKAIRTKNILNILKCRFFISDIFQQLKQSYSKYVESLEENVLTVYRGQIMTTDEFSMLHKNVNGLISLNSFVFTNTSPDTVFPFNDNANSHSLFEFVFFEIELTTNIKTNLFVKIKNNQCESENEVLLCMGSIFRIESVEKLSEDMWHVKLISINENDVVKLESLANFLKNDISEPLNCLAVGRILQKMGEYDKAQCLYETLLTELPLNHPDLGGIYNDIGITLFQMQHSSTIILNYLIQSLKLQLKTFPKYFLFFTQTLNNLASIYNKDGCHKRALSLLQLSLEVLDLDISINTPQAVCLQRTDTYNTIGHIYLQLGQPSISMRYFKMSLVIQKKVLASNHPDIAVSLDNIAMIYLKRLDYKNAGKYLDEAYPIVEECLWAEQYPNIGQVYNNIGFIEYHRGNLDKSLMCYAKSLKIQSKCLPSIHPKLAALYNNMGLVYFDRTQYSTALKFFKKSLNIEQQCASVNHSEISHIHQNIGKTYRSLKDYPNALIHCIDAIQIGLKYLPSTHHYLAEAYRTLARVYNDIKIYPKALENFQKALNIYLKNPPTDKTYLGSLYEDIGIGYYNTQQYNDSLENLRKATEILQKHKAKQANDDTNTAQQLITQIMSKPSIDAVA